MSEIIRQQIENFLQSSFARFLVVGTLNTAVAYVVYLVVLQFFPYVWAYTASYVTGIGIGYVLNAKWVYKGDMSVRTALGYPVIYAGQYLFGLATLYIFINALNIPEKIAPLFVVVFSVPFTYFLNKKLFTRKKKQCDESPKV